MQILTINLNQELAEQLSLHKEYSFCHAQSMADACHKTAHDEFNFILKKTDLEFSEDDTVKTLLGLTPISTKILLFGKDVDSQRLCTWRELGIDFIFDPTVPELIQKIQTNEP
ncbi:MAG: hypothetical protein JKY88_18090 [Pseudomonadales bacterium]|nr:hypothetical protein [Pseudomonadales bacterium]